MAIDLDVAKSIAAETMALGEPQSPERTLMVMTYVLGGIAKNRVYGAVARDEKEAAVYRSLQLQELCDLVAQAHILYEKMRHSSLVYRSIPWEVFCQMGLEHQQERMRELRKRRKEPTK